MILTSDKMFGLGETSGPDPPPVKTYRCVACSSTFLGLASLLVHQASHASEFSSPQPPPQPTCSSCGTVFFTRDLLKQHVCAAALPSATPEFYICDCGKECKDFNVFLEHKKSHRGESDQSHPETHQSGVNPEGLNEDSSGKAANSHPVPMHSSSSTDVSLPSSSVNMPPDCSDSVVSGINVNEDFATQTTIPQQNSNLAEELDPALDPAKLDLPLNIIEVQNNSLPDTETDESLQVSNNFASYSDNAEVQQNQNQDVKPARNKVVMKILAKAYMNVKQPPELELSANNLVESSRDVRTPGGSDVVTSPIRQLRPSVRRPFSTRRPTGRIGYGNNPSKKPLVISVAKRYCPVVLLETRQKFVGKNYEGNYQCGQCKRLFSNIDELALHHALHRKEKMKRCRRCKQFIISTSGPDSHICSRAPTAADQDLLSTGKEFTSSPKQSLKAVKTTQGSNRFHCPLCNHSYSRLYTLKMHNCEWISSLRDSAQEAVVNDCPEVEVNGSEANPHEYVSVGVGTFAQHQVKKEMLNESVEQGKRQTEPNNENPFEVANEPDSPEESLNPDSAVSISFEPRETVLKNGLVPTVQADTIEHVGTEETGDEDTVRICIGDQGEEDEVTSLGEEAEIDVLIEEDEDDLDHNDELHQTMVKGSAVLKSENEDIPVAIYDEYAKRFTCGRCHKSFTRNYGLKKHLKICATGKIGQPHIGASVARKILKSKKVFDCVQCGKIFSHMDSLAIHKRNCHTEMTRQLSEPYNTASQESVFVLPPQSDTQSNRPASTAENNETNWGIMSLPSVLPRRVTCECGSSFTCPRRLFEHLQMHAQESYICPHCGENLQSWMKYEVHLRSHLQFPQQAATGEQSQQYYVQRPQQPTTAQLSSQLPSSHVATQASSNCPKCFQTFKNRRNLLRHLRLRCHGEASAPKKYACSRCGMSFLSTYTLDLHMQSNTCTPSVKTMRCPVCVRWFRTVEGLKRHLIVHSQQKLFNCGLCPQSFSSPEDLEGHKKSVHDDVSVEHESRGGGSTREDSQNNQFKFFRCNTCPRVYHSMKSLKEHRRKVHSLLGGNHVAKTTETLGVVQNSQMNFFRCQLCQRTYHSLQSLKNHRRRVHRIFAGGHGQQRADSLGAVQNSPSNIFRCQICQRVYPTLKAWRNHRRRVHRILGGGSEMQIAESLRAMHSQANAFTCQICQRTYLTLQSLKDHRRKVHHIPGGRLEPQRGNAMASQSIVLTCQICHRTYGSLQSLKDHRRKVHHIPGGRLDVVKVE